MDKLQAARYHGWISGLDSIYLLPGKYSEEELAEFRKGREDRQKEHNASVQKWNVWTKTND